MSEMHILCGFDEPDFEKAIQLQLRTKGYEAVIHTQVSKKGVKNHIDRNPNCETVILQEIINGKKGYTAEEVATLTDKREVNVIIVLSARHIGSEYVKTLYSAGITNAIFQKGRKDGASAKDIVNLILNKRSRAEARKYYGIDSQKIEMGFIDEETYLGFYQKLHKDENLVKNYLEVCADLSPKQIGDFTRRLPVTEKEYLAQFEEFHMLMNALREFGIDLKIKRPKKTTIGLKVPHLITVQGDNIFFEKKDSVEEETVVEETVAEEKVSSSDKFKEDVVARENERADSVGDAFTGMSMEELLRAAGMNVVAKEIETETGLVDESVDVEPTIIKEDKTLKEVEAVLEKAKMEEERVKQDALEKEKQLQAQKEQLESERKRLDEEKAKQEKELAQLKKQMEKEQADVLKKMEKEREKERKEMQKRQKEEIARRQREESERAEKRRIKERVASAVEEDDDDDYGLTYGGNPFSGWILVLLFVLCAALIGFLFARPHLSQLGLLV